MSDGSPLASPPVSVAGPTISEQPPGGRSKYRTGSFVSRLYIIASILLVLGTLAAVIVAFGGGEWTDGLRWTLYMLASAAIAVIGGLIFGVPRARPGYAAEATERYESNSNLEQISDWLTKLLVGAGLVELKNLPGYVAGVGAYLGAGMTISNAPAFCVSAVVYGAGVGFVTAYLWTRLRMRYLLESSDVSAAEASKREERLVTSLSNSGLKDTPPESDSELRTAAKAALASSKALPPGTPTRPILWVDDNPSNNTAMVESLNQVGVQVDIALSTAEAMQRLKLKNYCLVVTDMGRRENGAYQADAGEDLVKAMRAAGMTTPVYVFAGQHGMEKREELMAAGATQVINKASALFTGATQLAHAQ